MSTAYCILYKLFTLKLTRKQLTGMLNHVDSPYIRGLGFLYIRSVLKHFLSYTVQTVYYGHLKNNQKYPDYQGLLIFQVICK